METKKLHIVCLDAPSPPNYGGAIDMYYGIKALGMMGHRIILHYFNYKEGRSAEGLEAYCESIHFYNRKGKLSSAGRLPFIVSSRISEDLVQKLNADNHPIILQGLHCAGILHLLNNRERVVLRMHNHEAAYYKSLYRMQSFGLKKIYFKTEFQRLQKFQDSLPRDLAIAPLSQSDISIFAKEGFQNLQFVPCFIPWQKINSREGKGDYCLYHGNLAVNENEAAAIWLLDEVFSKIQIPFVIAGSSLGSAIKKKASKLSNVKLIPDPPQADLNGLIRDAHINLLPSLNNTGVKLKLLHSLFEGRHCIANKAGFEGSGLQEGIDQANEGEEFIKAIEKLWDKPFTAEDAAKRIYLENVYSNENSALKLSELLKHYQ